MLTSCQRRCGFGPEERGCGEGEDGVGVLEHRECGMYQCEDVRHPGGRGYDVGRHRTRREDGCGSDGRELSCEER